jgi:hypothetical protein
MKTSSDSSDFVESMSTRRCEMTASKTTSLIFETRPSNVLSSSTLDSSVDLSELDPTAKRMETWVSVPTFEAKPAKGEDLT